VSLLDRKLGRDLRAMRAQVLTISLVVAAGVSVFVASVSTYNSLAGTAARFYEQGRFPDIFVSLKRAPLSVASRLGEISGVVAAEPRIVRDVIADLPQSMLPVSLRIVSLPADGNPTLSRPHLRRGIAPRPGETRVALVNEGFAEANRLAPGDTIRVLLGGRVETFQISGIALSPEYVFAVKPGVPLPDDRFFGVLWVDRAAAEGAFAMDGAFNDLVVSLAPAADRQAVIEELDRVLQPYGSLGAIERRDQPSNRYLEDELTQQRVMSTTIPFIFFGIAAFLINVALGRIVTAQREQIASLKSLGFANAPLVLHYLKLVAVIVLIGSVLGAAGGWAFGRAMIESYRGFFRFPELTFSLTPWSLAVAIAISFIAATVGVLSALRNVVSLSPAVAMRPAAPQELGRAYFERLWTALAIGPRAMMVLRGVTGRPVRTLLTILGVALAVPMVVLGMFWRDAIDHMLDVQFNLIERGNAAVFFSQPVDAGVVRDLANLPGIIAVEGHRIVPVRLRAAHRTYRTAVIGLPAGGRLRQPREVSLRPIEPAAEGVTLSSRLADRLAVKPGDDILVEALEGRRRSARLVVSATVEEMLGMAAYMEIGALNRMTGEGDVVSSVALFIEPSAIESVSRRFKQLPVVASVTMQTYLIRSFFEQIGGLVLVSAAILTGFAVIIAVGVVYNSARISLQERAWELATLRVLGFTRGEISTILFSEFTIEIALGVPLGMALSQGLVELIAHYWSTEMFQIPATIGTRSYASAAVVVVAAAAASAYFVRRQIDRLDLVAVLKTRD
jgi:putative ABC transport system permease protein